MSNTITIIKDGNICSPKGFKSSGVKCGLKVSGDKDIALIVSDVPAIAAALFTSSKVQAAPVLISKEQIANSKTFRAIIANSGNANACTGEVGLRDSQQTIELLASELNIPKDEILISSTGRIGVNLPMDNIKAGIPLAVKALSTKGGNDTSAAIMTTDTVPKEIAVTFKIDNHDITIAGIAKGAGMIAPNMELPHATMLSYITTDALIDQELLNCTLNSANQESFNKITVDGDMSTNDTVYILANGLADNRCIEKDTPEAELFLKALREVMEKLAKDIVLDGEGITKFVTVQVVNANSASDAKLVTRAISDSLLCKTAWFGCDPNWGRIIAAAGYSGAQFDATKINLHYNDLPVVLNGIDAGTKESDLVKLMKQDKFTITVDLNNGDYSDEMWTNDISYEYVKINADYHT